MMPRFRAWRRAHMADRSKGARLGLRRWPPAVCPVRCWIRRPWCWWTVGSTPTSLGRVRVGRRVIEKVSAGDPKKASIKRHFLISEGFIPLSSLTHVPHTIQPYRTLRTSHAHIKAMCLCCVAHHLLASFSHTVTSQQDGGTRCQGPAGHFTHGLQ